VRFPARNPPDFIVSSRDGRGLDPPHLPLAGLQVEVAPSRALCCVMPVPERIVSLLQQLTDDVAADLTPATVAYVTVEKTTPESTSANIEVAVQLAPKIAKRRSRSIKPAIDPSALRNLESLPLFAPDNMLGAALFGPDRVQEWCQTAPMLEARGLPKVDPLMGGRYKRAVVAFFDQQYGLDRDANPPLAPDGVEDFDSWKRRKRPV
jgi:hypothetical protein